MEIDIQWIPKFSSRAAMERLEAINSTLDDDGRHLLQVVRFPANTLTGNNDGSSYTTHRELKMGGNL